MRRASARSRSSRPGWAWSGRRTATSGRAQPSSSWTGCHDRQYQPAADPDPAERAARAVLRNDRPTRRLWTRQLRSPAPVAPTPAEEQPERALQLDDCEVPERSRDDGDHRADDCEFGRPGFGLLVLLVGLLAGLESLG